MIGGAHDEARWVRQEPRRTLAAGVVERIVESAFPRTKLLAMQFLTGGLRNANFRLDLDTSPYTVVLRVYEHDTSICQKEVDLIQLIGRSMPVSDVLYAEPAGTADTPPFALLRFVEGISLRELIRCGSAASIAEAAHSAGATYPCSANSALRSRDG